MTAALAAERLDRLRRTMDAVGCDAALTADPINICYATGARNMTVFGMMGPSRFVLVLVDGPVVLYEFAGCEHLAAELATVDEVRVAPGITALSGPDHLRSVDSFASEIAGFVGAGRTLAVERVDFAVTDALRSRSLRLSDATALFSASRRVKLPGEISQMRAAIRLLDPAVTALEAAVGAGRTEVEVWAEFHRRLIADNGEYVSTRLFQSGSATFPYFREAGSRVMADGELVCLDTDAIGYGGYGVDFSRTFLVGAGPPTIRQRELYRLAHAQLRHNAELLAPGRSYEEMARTAWPVPEQHRPYGYYCLAHGLGMSGEYPYVPVAVEGEPYEFCGEFEPGMVICVESYIGDPDSGQGVKLEDQFLITDDGADRLTAYPFDDRLLGSG